MDRCTDQHDITETLLKAPYNQSISICRLLRLSVWTRLQFLQLNPTEQKIDTFQPFPKGQNFRRDQTESICRQQIKHCQYDNFFLRYSEGKGNKRAMMALESLT